MTTRTLGALLTAWNDATAPYEPRTDHQHHRQAQRARAVNRALIAGGYVHGRDWRELSSGARIMVLRQQALI